MPKLLTLTVTQSPAQLQKLMAEQTTNWARERLHALYLYASGIAPFENTGLFHSSFALDANENRERQKPYCFADPKMKCNA
ncbi:MAG: hypothetical protein KME03_18645 [Aphanocapsa lilacina HA4352-LM1]|jgi:uncharacterized protein (DUF2132 family)|nr:hypothetical protein [Aphanocapsa lilacina HA4352-LM1]